VAIRAQERERGASYTMGITFVMDGGFSRAGERMGALARMKPGKYFLHSTVSNTVLAIVDTTVVEAKPKTKSA